VQALLNAIVLFCLLPRGFSNRDLRQYVAPLLGKTPTQLSAGSMTYDLRRLRLHGLIERIPKSHRYKPTAFGLRTAVFLSRLYGRALRPGLALVTPLAPASTLQRSFNALDDTLRRWHDKARIAA
jgi:hypothetical protein